MAETDALDIPLDIAFVRMESSDHLTHLVRKQAKKLERFRDRIIHVRAAISAEHKGSEKPEIQVKVEVSIKGDLIVAKRSGRPHRSVDNADFYGILREAFDVAVREVDKYISKHYDPVKGVATASRPARITRLDRERRTGMLETETGQSLFFQDSAVSGEDFETLEEGVEVVYTMAVAEGAYGPEAATITRAVGVRSEHE